jgi:hypothetical protein
MKVTFDTETDSYEQALTMLRAAYGRGHDSGESLTGTVLGDGTLGNGAPGGSWTRRELESFARGLDQNTAEAIRYIAAHAPAAPIAATLEHVSRYMFSLRFMSQFGQVGSDEWPFGNLAEGLVGQRAGIVIPDGADSPVTRDDENRTYRMDSAVATIITEIMGPPVPEPNPSR